MTSFFGRIGHGLKVAVVDTGKAVADGAKVAGTDAPKVILPAVEIAATIAPIPGAGAASSLLQVLGEHVKVFSKEHNTIVNPIEQFAITIVLGLLQQIVKNPNHAAILRAQLVGVADDIYTAYGLTPPAPAATTALPPSQPGK